MKKLFAYLIALALAFVGLSPTPAEAHGHRQWRSYWVDAFNPGIYTPEEVAGLVSDAKAVGANALLVQTVRRFDCFCNQATYPRTGAAIAAEPYDSLAEIVAQGAPSRPRGARLGERNDALELS